MFLPVVAAAAVIASEAGVWGYVPPNRTKPMFHHIALARAARSQDRIQRPAIHRSAKLMSPLSVRSVDTADVRVNSGGGARMFRQSLGIGAWFVAISYFIVRNYKFGPWPVWLSSQPKRFWLLVHATCSMLFSGGIIVSTVIEWLVVGSARPDVVAFWFSRVSNIDKALVLPALSGAIVSGMAQAAQDYGCMGEAPKHIRRAIHILATFALWWGSTDLTTQRSAKESVAAWQARARDGASSASGVPSVLHFRRWSNVVSCLFVGSLYALMALKPGYD